MLSGCSDSCKQLEHSIGKSSGVTCNAWRLAGFARTCTITCIIIAWSLLQHTEMQYLYDAVSVLAI